MERVNPVTMRTARQRGKSGQTMTESMLVIVILTGMVALMALLLYTFKEYGGRIIELVSSEYP